MEHGKAVLQIGPIVLVGYGVLICECDDVGKKRIKGACGTAEQSMWNYLDLTEQEVNDQICSQYLIFFF